MILYTGLTRNVIQYAPTQSYHIILWAVLQEFLGGYFIMALISCPECGHSISDKALSCPSCGYPINISTTIPAQSTSKRTPKKRRKLPNGSGSIKHLSGKRSKPWAAYPPVKEFTLTGSPILNIAIGYFKTYDQAYQALMLYNSTSSGVKQSSISLSDLYATMLSNHNGAVSPQYLNITFAELYDQFFESKYEKSKKKLSNASRNSTKAAFNNCKKLHDRKFADLRKADLQDIVDTCPLKHSSLELIVSLFKGMYAYALQNDIVEKDYSQFVTINIPDDDESGVPFSQEALDILWKHSNIENVGMILLMIYTGFRITAFKTIKYNTTEQYFQGGVKTAAGKNRIVPLHPAIQGFAKTFSDTYCSGNKTFSSHTFRAEFYTTLDSLGLLTSTAGTKHTPHDCRHTFSWICDKYKIDDLSKHLLMGHSLGNDIEKSVYSHRTLEELRTEIEKIKVPNFK